MLHTSLEQRPILHDQLDVLDRQIDEHASDLGGLGSNQAVDVIVEHCADLILVVRIFCDHSGEDLLAGQQVALFVRHLLLLLLLGHGCHLLLLLLLLHHLHLLRIVATHLAAHAHVRSGIAAHLRCLVHGVAAVHLVAWAVVGADLALWLLSLVASWATWMSSHGALLLLHEVGHGLKQHLEVELEFFLVGQISPFGTLRVLLAELLEVVFVTGSLVLKLTHLLDLVVVDGQGLVIDGEVLFGRGGLVRLLEADESVELLDAITRRVHPQTLDLAVLGEELAEVLFGHRVWEALHVKVASLFGALVLDRLTQALGLTVGSLECFLDVQLLVVGKRHTIDHALSVELGDGFLSASWSIFAVHAVVRVEADEGIWAFFVSHVLHALNATELTEQIMDLLLSVVHGEVLRIDVVVDLAEVAFVAWLVANDLILVSVALCFQGFGGRRWVLEAHETVAARLMVRVERDLEGLDVTVAGEVFLELGWRQFLRDAAHKDVVIDNLLRVGAEQVVVEGQGATGLAWCKLKVAHLFASELEFVFLRDLHDGRVKWAVQVTSDLWNTGEHDASLLLQHRGQLGAGGLGLGEIVEIEVVLSTLGVVHNHVEFCCFVFVLVGVFFVFVFIEKLRTRGKWSFLLKIEILSE